MDFLQETREVLAYEDRDQKLDGLCDLEERIQKAIWRKDVGEAAICITDDVGQAAALLLTAALSESDAQVSEDCLWVLSTAIGCHDIGAYLDWERLIQHLPRFSGERLCHALEVLGYSEQQAFLAVLQDYLEHESTLVQLTALDAICTIWWNLGQHAPELKEQMQTARMHQIWSALLNHQLPEATIRAEISQMRPEVLAKMREWLERHS